jgi:hypothetical protein
METIKLWARNGAAVRQAIEVGELVHLETASEELTDALLLVAIPSGLLAKWAAAFPEPRCEPEISMEVLCLARGGTFCGALFEAQQWRCAACGRGVRRCGF